MECCLVQSLFATLRTYLGCVVFVCQDHCCKLAQHFWNASHRSGSMSRTRGREFAISISHECGSREVIGEDAFHDGEIGALLCLEHLQTPLAMHSKTVEFIPC